jgi:NAD(P)-dependent dehydrogenase (short-subunit alcohol dehydrogenase family)
MTGISSYGSSKMGGTRLFECIQDEYSHIRVTTLHPGAVVTEMAKEIFKSGKQIPLDDSEKSLAHSFKRFPRLYIHSSASRASRADQVNSPSCIQLYRLGGKQRGGICKGADDLE